MLVAAKPIIPLQIMHWQLAAAVDHSKHTYEGHMMNQLVVAVRAQVVDFAGMTDARELFFWRLFFRELLNACSDGATAAGLFARLAAVPDLKPLARALTAFLRTRYGPWLVSKDAADAELEKLQTVEGTLRSAGRAAM
jgi:hypothetical protein